jgi:hypothetical protein
MAGACMSKGVVTIPEEARSADHPMRISNLLSERCRFDSIQKLTIQGLAGDKCLRNIATGLHDESLRAITAE